MARILVIDDEPGVRRLLKMCLEKHGHVVSVAEDGNAGLTLNRLAPSDIIITDIVMPDKDGLETIQELRTEFPLIKIVAISGGGRVAGNDYLKIAQKLGAARTFSKPFSVEELVQAVEELVEPGTLCPEPA
jgi:CheY-like chemotaxis protein